MSALYLGSFAWRKSGYSANNGACVEVAFAADFVAVRDSKNPDGPRLRFGDEDWARFATRAKGGRFDRY